MEAWNAAIELRHLLYSVAELSRRRACALEKAIRTAAKKADPIFQLAAADIGAPVPEFAVES